MGAALRKPRGQARETREQGRTLSGRPGRRTVEHESGDAGGFRDRKLRGDRRRQVPADDVRGPCLERAQGFAQVAGVVGNAPAGIVLVGAPVAVDIRGERAKAARGEQRQQVLIHAPRRGRPVQQDERRALAATAKMHLAGARVTVTAAHARRGGTRAATHASSPCSRAQSKAGPGSVLRPGAMSLWPAMRSRASDG